MIGEKIDNLKDKQDITCVAFSFDGKYLVTGSKESILQIWNVKNNFNNDISMKAGDKEIRQIVFSANGKYLVTICQESLSFRIWDADKDFNLIKTIEEENNINAIAFSGDGKYFRKTLNYKKLSMNKKQQKIAFSAKGEYLATCSNDTCKIWVVEKDYQLINTIKGDSLDFISVEFSKDGKYLATCSQNYAYLWEVKKDFHLKKKSPNDEQYLISITFSPEGKYLVASNLGSFTVWNIENEDFQFLYRKKKGESIFSKHTSFSQGINLVAINSNYMAFSPDGKYFVFCFGDKYIYVMNAKKKFQLIYLNDRLSENIFKKNKDSEEVEIIENNKLYFLISIILNNLLFSIIPTLFSLASTIAILLCKSETKKFFLAFLLLINTYSNVYFLLNVLFFPIENEILLDFQLDCVFFYLSSNLVLSYLKSNYQYPYNSIKSIFTRIINTETFYTLFYFNDTDNDKLAYLFDYKQQDISNILGKFEFLQDIPSTFSDFTNRIGEISNLIKYEDFNGYLEPNFNSFFLLMGIFLLKIIFCFYFIILKVSDITIKQYFDIIAITFVYIQSTFNLNRVLGNYDLRKKYTFMAKLNNFIDFQKFSEIDLYCKLDVTCPNTLEVWDYARKIILNYEKEWFATLEVSYFCLILYYVLVTFVNLSAYFEFYWIIPEDSILLNPIIVIMCTFNFIFLTVFFLMRFYEGSKFNDAFEDLNQNLQYLIDIMDDLDTMFDFYFDKMKLNVNSDEFQSIYLEMSKKINKLSQQKIMYKIEYEGRIYGEEQIIELQKKILMNAKLSLEKVNRSVNIDSKLHKYKFLNLVEINFQDIAYGFLFAVITTLPAIIPKFIKLFTNEKTN